MNSANSATPARNTAKKTWEKSPAANLYRYVPSGGYYARFSIKGKMVMRSLETDRFSVAQLRLGDLIKEERSKLDGVEAVAKGKMLFKHAMETYLNRLDGDMSMKPRSREYRRERLAALIKSWPALPETDVRKVSRQDCQRWAANFAKRAAPSNYNNTLGTLRQILDVALEAGAIYSNPVSGIKRLRVRPKQLRLPSHEEFLAIVEAIRNNDGAYTQRCSELVRFLAYGGFRKGEAASITWADCDLAKGEILVRGDVETGTKNWGVRRVPMIPEMKQMLTQLREGRPTEPPETPVMRVKECQGAITTACEKLGIRRFTHHDLRHLFATRSIESGVDIPTLSRWLGHKDGGALAMKIYGHLRNEHSTEMAQKVSYSRITEPENVGTTPKAS